MHHLIFIANLLIPSRLTIANASNIVTDVWQAMSEEDGTTLEDGRRALVWMAKESGFLPVMGDCNPGTKVNCKACGRGQLHKEWWDGNTCDAILSDRVLDIRLWIRALHFTKKYCAGNEKEALAALASGNCKAYYTSALVKSIVDNREKVAFYERYY